MGALRVLQVSLDNCKDLFGALCDETHSCIAPLGAFDVTLLPGG